MDKTHNDEKPIRTIELEAEVDDQHRLHAQLPEDVPASRVRVIVLLDSPTTAADTAPENATSQVEKPRGFDASSFGGVRISTRGFRLNRDETNER